MEVFVLKVEKAGDDGLSFDAVPFKEEEAAVAEAKKRVEDFKDEIVREYKKGTFIEDYKPESLYVATDWSMSLYIFCKVTKHTL